MSIDEYNSKFVQIAHYAPHMVPDEKRHIRAFILGLCQSFYQAISPQVNVYPSYAAMVEATRKVKYGHKTKGNNSKKKGLDHEGKSSKFGSAKGSKPFGRGKFSSGAPPASVQSTTNTSRRQGQSSTQQGSTQSWRDKPKSSTCTKFHLRTWLNEEYGTELNIVK